MGEITRAVLDKSSLAMRPKCYVSDASYIVPQTAGNGFPLDLFGSIQTDQSSHFLMTSCFFDAVYYDATPNTYIKNIMSSGSTYGTVSLRNLDNNQEYMERSTLSLNISTSANDSIENYEYVYLPPNSRLQWKYKNVYLNAANPLATLQVVFLMTGIEYLMPDDKIQSFANG